MASHHYTGPNHQVSSSPPPTLPSEEQERRPLLAEGSSRSENDEQVPLEQEDDSKMGWVRQNKWIVLAIASGACAAFNGVFAKLYVVIIIFSTTPFFSHLSHDVYIASSRDLLRLWKRDFSSMFSLPP